MTEHGDASVRKAAVPKMVLAEELRPVPVLPNRIILKGSASDVAKHRKVASQTPTKVASKPVAKQHFCNQEMESMQHALFLITLWTQIIL